MVPVDVTGPHLIRRPLTSNNTVQTCQANTIDNEPIPSFWWKFLRLSLPWHTDITQWQWKCWQRQHLRYILYSPSLGIGWWSKKMIKYYVTNKASISTLTRIIYTGIYNYGDANLYVTFLNKSQKQKQNIPPECRNYFHYIP